MKPLALIYCLVTAALLSAHGGVSMVNLNNPSFEANRSTSGTGAFGSGDLQDLGLASPTGWAVIATDNTAAGNNGQEVAFGWANLVPADPLAGPPQPQVVSLMAGAVIGQATDIPWSSLIVGDMLTLVIAAGDRNVNAPTGTPRWADESFFGLTDGLATRATGTPGGSGSGWIGNLVTTVTVDVPPTGYKGGAMGDVFLTHVVTAADLLRTGNVGVVIASVGDRDGTGNGTTVTSRQSFWDHVRLELTTLRPTINTFVAAPAAISVGASSTLTWDVMDAATVTINNGLGTVFSSGSQAISPAATTTYTLTAVNTYGSATRSVTVTVVPQGPYRYYRFVPTALRNTGAANSISIAEFQMLLNNTRVGGAVASAPGGNSPGSESPEQANDDSVSTKWLDFTKFTPLVLDFGVTTDVNGYRLGTANDSEERDPVSWRVEGSHDKVAWVTIDEQFDYPVPVERSIYLPDFALAPFSTGPGVTFTATPASIQGGSSSTLAWNVTGADYISINNGIGVVPATGSTNVSPSATTTYTLTATNLSGTTMRSVTLTVIPPGPYRYYKFVPVALRGGGNTVQLCEFQMIFAGNRVGGATATNPGGSNPPNAGEGAEKANDNLPAVSDGSPDTKWLDDNKQPLILDFGTTTDVTGYRWATGNDSDDRDPVTWRVEGSHDNLNWTVLDRQTNYAVPTARKTYLSDFALQPFGSGPVASFSANPATIVVGTSSTLSWSVSNATSITINNGIGAVAASGSMVVSPAATTTYTLTATNTSGITTRSVVVTVVAGLPLTYNFDDGTFQDWTDVSLGNTGTRGWSAITGWGGIQSGAHAIRSEYHDDSHPTMILRSPEFVLNGSGDLSAWVAGGDGAGSLAGTAVSALQTNSTDQGFMGIALRNKSNGQYVLSASKNSDGDAYQKLVFTAEQLGALDTNATYTLDLVDTCHGSWAWVAMDTVTIPGNLGSGPTNAPVIYSFGASPATIMTGQSSTLSWSVSNATSVTINNSIGTVPATGSQSVSPTVTTTYTLTATGPGGVASATAKVTVFIGALQGKVYDTIGDETYLDPISNLMGQTPSALFEQLNDLAYEGDFVGNPDLPGITGPNDFSILWQGWFNVTIEGPGAYTFGTESDDGSVIYLDLNEDGDFNDAGELIVNNNGMHPKFTETGTVDLQMDEVRIAIAYYQAGMGAAMAARFGKGDSLAYASLQPISGVTGHFKGTNSFPLTPSVTFAADPAGILSGQSSTLTWSVLNATNITIDNGIGTVSANGSVVVTPGVSTTYTLTAQGPGGTRTKTATVAIVPPGPYRYYRFAPTALRDANNANSIQIAEFEMLQGGVRIPGATASNPGGDSPTDESPAQAVDNDLNTKWLDFTKFTPLVLDFGTSTPANGYRWATANDADERDPVSWRLDGSHDGIAWVSLDVRLNVQVPSARNTYLSAFVIGQHPAFGITSITYAQGSVTLTWDSKPQAKYTIEATSDLANPNGWSPALENILSDGTTTTRSVPVTPGLFNCFRIRVQP